MRGKLCDAADWFGRELPRLIQSDLREPPRFHRKQWEFGMILGALDAEAALDADSRASRWAAGASACGRSSRGDVDRLVVTDLYGSGSDGRRPAPTTRGDFIRAHMPFPVDLARIDARRMDMRQLDLAPDSSDFCYSSCAIEHIGGRDDFLGPLREHTAS